MSKKVNRNPIRWALFVIWVLFNIPLLGIPEIIRRGPKRLWEEFGSYALGTFKSDESGKILWIKFVNYPDLIHFHWMVWSGFLLAALLNLGALSPFTVAILYFVTFLICLLSYMRDTPFWSFVGLLGILTLIVIADFGVSLGMGKFNEVLTPLREGEGVGRIFALAIGWLPASLERGILRPIWDFISWLSPEASPGFFVVMSLLFTAMLAKPVGLAIMRERKKLTSSNLFEKSFAEKDTTEPIYMRRSTLALPDMFEAAVGFGAFRLMVRTGLKRFENVWGASLWLRGAFQRLRKQAEDTSDSAAEREARQEEEASTLVREDDHAHDAEDGAGRDGDIPDATDDDHR